MKGKLLFVAGLGVGYILGARAGRKRYEQIAAAAHKVWDTPGIQKQVHQVQDFAAETVGDIPGQLIDASKKAVASVVSAGKSAASKASTKASTVTTNSASAAAEATAATVGEAAAASASEEKTEPAATEPAYGAKKAPAKKPSSTKPAKGSAKDGE
jgi:hypothetical protein